MKPTNPMKQMKLIRPIETISYGGVTNPWDYNDKLIERVNALIDAHNATVTVEAEEPKPKPINYQDRCQRAILLLERAKYVFENQSLFSLTKATFVIDVILEAIDILRGNK